MASCAFCGTTIFLGGVKDGELRFCNRTCHERGAVAHMTAQIPDMEAQSYAMRIHGGPCPKCEGPGPNDVFNSYTVWSFILLTSWKSQPQISCKSCAVKSQALGFVSSFFLGWWGIPWGIIMTPVQMIRNLWGMTRSAGDVPSDELQRMSRLMMVQNHLAAARLAAGG